ncbi:MAG: peptide chain release factor 1, partial [Candidatus Micrarchaeia archaeon]
MAADKKKRELMKLLNKLGKIRGSGTELISLYVPAGYPLTEVVNKLRSEHGQAGNIKSKTTRTNVQDAIDKIINYLKFFKKTPDKGLAIFCGNISKDPRKTDIQLFSIEPPLPIQVSIYRCDSEFILEPLAEQGKVKEKYGLVTIDGKEATIGVLEGNVTKILKRLTTTGPSKSTKGGSSAARYQRFVE